MGNLELGYHSLKQNYGYLIDKAPQVVLDELKLQINELQSDFSKGEKFNDKLVGEIQHEYSIRPKNQLISYIKELAQQFENESKYLASQKDPLPIIKFDNIWVNFQKKYEYNPIHSHGGAYSFVLWYQIPYLIKEERSKHGYKSNLDNIHHGQFHFIVPEQEKNIAIYHLEVDQSKEGYIAIFPSNLNHTVYPFYTSDEYRITVAGNIETINKVSN